MKTVKDNGMIKFDSRVLFNFVSDQRSVDADECIELIKGVPGANAYIHGMNRLATEAYYSSHSYEMYAMNHEDFASVDEAYEYTFECFRDSARLGFAPGQFVLGLYYLIGSEGSLINGGGLKDVPVSQSYRKALGWISKAANQGFGQAQYTLSCLYADGKGVKKSLKKAAFWMEQAALNNYDDAVYEIGLIYEKGEGVKQSYKTAAHWYREAVKTNRQPMNAKAEYRLGLLYREGKGVAKSQSMAFEFFNRLSLMDSYPELAECYFYGEGVNKSYGKCLETLLKYFKWLEKGNGIYIDRDYTDAKVQRILNEFFKALEMDKDRLDGETMYQLFVCYKNGLNGEKSEKKSVEWLKKSAEAGDVQGLFDLGICYCHGEGVEKSYEKAIEIFDRILSSDEEQKMKYVSYDCESAPAGSQAKTLKKICLANLKGKAKDVDWKLLETLKDNYVGDYKVNEAVCRTEGGIELTLADESGKGPALTYRVEQIPGKYECTISKIDADGLPKQSHTAQFDTVMFRYVSRRRWERDCPFEKLFKSWLLAKLKAEISSDDAN